MYSTANQLKWTQHTPKMVQKSMVTPLGQNVYVQALMTVLVQLCVRSGAFMGVLQATLKNKTKSPSHLKKQIKSWKVRR